MHVYRAHLNLDQVTAVTMNARLYALAARMVYLAKMAVKQALVKAKKHYVPPKFDLFGTNHRGGHAPTSRSAVQAARDAHYEQMQLERTDRHDGKFLSDWLKEVVIRVKKKPYKRFVRFLGKHLIRVQAARMQRRLNAQEQQHMKQRERDRARSRSRSRSRSKSRSRRLGGHSPSAAATSATTGSRFVPPLGIVGDDEEDDPNKP